jgi:spore coat polysaccharide biosynthesis protein SpsF
MNNLAVVLSARMASSRLPGKAMLPLNGIPMIQFIIERLRKSERCTNIILATTDRSEDDVLCDLATNLGINLFRGDSEDVAGRYMEVSKKFDLEWIVRVTGDCPFIDGTTLDYCLSQLPPECEDVLWTTKNIFPVGIDYELISCSALANEWPQMSVKEKEHVTLRFYRTDLNKKIIFKNFSPPPCWPSVSETFTVDTLEDYERASEFVASLSGTDFSVSNLLKISGALR